MIIYSETLNVYEAAKQRIHKLYDTGRHISVGFSGGKDSTVLLEVTLEVAKERGISKSPFFSWIRRLNILKPLTTCGTL